MTVRGQNSRKAGAFSLPLSRSSVSENSAAEFLEVAAALVWMSWNGDLNGWVSAGEVANSLRTGETAQHMGQQLAMWERRGLVESKREEWGKMWRLCAALRTLLGGRL